MAGHTVRVCEAIACTVRQCWRERCFLNRPAAPAPYATRFYCVCSGSIEHFDNAGFCCTKCTECFRVALAVIVRIGTTC